MIAVRPAEPADVVLATGAVATIRPVQPTDRAGLHKLYERADPASLRLRFFSYSPTAARRDVERMLRPASADHVGYVVTSQGVLIGMGCVERTSHHGVGDLSLLVDDTHHGEGVGTLLIERLVAAAREAGYHRIHADVLAENTKMLRVLRALGADTASHLDYGVVNLEFAVNGGDKWQAAVERRESFADHASIRRLLAPSSIAVIGAGHRPSSVGRRLLRSITDGGYTGRTYAVSRSGASIDEVTCTGSLDQLPEVPELVVVAVPAIEVPDVIATCAAQGVRGAVVVSDGFAELGEDGRQAQQEMVTIARRAGMRLIGPNCLGVVNTTPDVRLNATFADLTPLPGRIGFASQSGGVGLAALSYLARRRLGVSSFVSLGNKADVSGNDLLLYWEQDPGTRTCLLYLESLGNAHKFARIAARVGRTKPIVAITAGHSQAGARGVRSHTAAAATPAVTLDALFSQAGVIGTGSMAAAVDVVTLLEHVPLPRGRRVGVVTNGGGPGALTADACVASHLELPELSPAVRRKLAAALPTHASTANPVDTTAGGTAEVLAAAARILLDSDEVDTVMVVHTSLSGEDTAELADALATLAPTAARKPLIPVYVGRSEGVESELPAFDFPEPAAAALAAVATYAEWRAMPPSRPPRLARIHRRKAQRLIVEQLSRRPEGGWLDIDVGAELLSAYGIPVVATKRATTIVEAVSAARSLGYPVVVKAAAGAVVHRSDVGAVHLDISSDREVAAAVGAIKAACGAECPVAVQPMVASGVETAIGIVNDSSVGPIVMFALGGVATDLLADRSFRLPPLSRADVRAQIRSLRSAPLLFGYRGRPPADVAALEDLLLRVSQLATDLPEIADLDLNPVVVSGDGAIAVDVKVRLTPADTADLYARQLAAPR